MSKRMSSSEFQRREFEKELAKALTVIEAELRVFQDTLFSIPNVTKRLKRAYNIAEMRTALREEQQGGE